jgi:hypothetical protein
MRDTGSTLCGSGLKPLSKIILRIQRFELNELNTETCDIDIDFFCTGIFSMGDNS